MPNHVCITATSFAINVNIVLTLAEVPTLLRSFIYLHFNRAWLPPHTNKNIVVTLKLTMVNLSPYITKQQNSFFII